MRELKMQHPPTTVVVSCAKGERKYSACGTCGQITLFNDEYSLNNCKCIPRLCDCGAAVYYDNRGVCLDCYRILEAEHIEECAVKATKVSLAEYRNDYVYCEEHDKFLDNNGELDDFLYDLVGDGQSEEDYLEYIASLHFFGATKQYISFDAVNLIEDFVIGECLDESEFSTGSVRLLQAALDAWCTDHKEECYAVCHDYSVLVDVRQCAREIYAEYKAKK